MSLQFNIKNFRCLYQSMLFLNHLINLLILLQKRQLFLKNRYVKNRFFQGVP